MHKFNLPDNAGTICYFTKEEVEKGSVVENARLLKEVYAEADKIARRLDVPCPNIAIADFLIQQNEKTNIQTDLMAYTYHANDNPGLDNSLVILSKRFIYWESRIGVIAHEIRHIYQKKYHPELCVSYAQGYFESLSDQAEIDADAFGIYYLSQVKKISINEAASLLCPTEKAKNYNSFLVRVQAANKLITVK